MLVIISDLHLTDGTSSETVHQGTLRVFRERLRSLAYAASWRADGKYRPIERLDVLLLGDIVDVLRSTRWLDEDGLSRVRPWSDPRGSDLLNKVWAITTEILERNAVFFAMLRELHHTSIATVPPATADGRPARASEESEAGARVPVQVAIHYTTGNHDWLFHLPHAGYSEIRRYLVERLGLENDPELPFPHDPGEPAAAPLRRILDEHRVLARHGDIFDPLNYEGNRDQATLGDAVVVDLLMSFAARVKARLAEALPPECVRGLKEIDNVRPLSLVPVWVGALLRRTCPNPQLHRRVRAIWNELADEFVHIPFVRERFTSSRHPVEIEKLKWALRLSKKLLEPQCSRLLLWAGGKAGQQKTSYAGHALQEPAFKDRASRFIVYGHTHHHEVVPLDSWFSSTSPAAQIYLNSGTWRPVHELTRFRPAKEAFVGYHAMTYLVFFKDDERGGRGFECWSGNLAPGTPRPL